MENIKVTKQQHAEMLHDVKNAIETQDWELLDDSLGKILNLLETIDRFCDDENERV